MTTANEQGSHDNSNSIGETTARKSGGGTQKEELADASGRDRVKEHENKDIVDDPPPNAIPRYFKRGPARLRPLRMLSLFRGKQN
jgi:hypothetical protein